jgi:hypothetical protein
VAGEDAAVARFVPVDEVGRYKLTDGAQALIERAWERLQQPPS